MKWLNNKPLDAASNQTMALLGVILSLPKDKKGFVIIFVMMVVLALSILIPSFFSLAFSTYNVAMLDGQRQQAYYNANSGIEYALFILEHPGTYGTPPDPQAYPWPIYGLPSGTFTVTITPGSTSGTYSIISTGTVNNNITAVRTVNYVVSGGIVDSWS